MATLGKETSSKQVKFCFSHFKTMSVIVTGGKEKVKSRRLGKKLERNSWTSFKRADEHTSFSLTLFWRYKQRLHLLGCVTITKKKSLDSNPCLSFKSSQLCLNNQITKPDQCCKTSWSSVIKLANTLTSQSTLAVHSRTYRLWLSPINS